MNKNYYEELLFKIECAENNAKEALDLLQLQETHKTVSEFCWRRTLFETVAFLVILVYICYLGSQYNIPLLLYAPFSILTSATFIVVFEYFNKNTNYFVYRCLPFFSQFARKSTHSTLYWKTMFEDKQVIFPLLNLFDVVIDEPKLSSHQAYFREFKNLIENKKYKKAAYAFFILWIRFKDIKKEINESIKKLSSQLEYEAYKNEFLTGKTQYHKEENQQPHAIADKEIVENKISNIL